MLAALGSAAQLRSSVLKTVLMRPYHAKDMSQSALAALQAAFKCSGTAKCSAVEVLDEWQNPKLNRPAAISDDRLAELATELNLVSVSAAPFLV